MRSIIQPNKVSNLEANLTGVHLIVMAFSFNQFIVSALLDNFTVGNDHNFINSLNCRKSVGNNQAGATGTSQVKGFLYNLNN